MRMEVDDGRIVATKETGLELEFRAPPSISEHEEVERFAQLFKMYQPSVVVPEYDWNAEELEKFLDRRSDSVGAFLQVLASHEGEWVSLSEVLEEMAEILDAEYDSSMLRGVLMALNKSIYHGGKPEHFERDWDDEDHVRYRLVELWREIVEDYCGTE